MRNLPWKSILAWLVAAFFVVGGIGNIFASEGILRDYARWGYPDWFHYVTGLLELIAAGLIAYSRSRRIGAIIAATVMLGAIATLLRNGEFSHALAPMLILLFTGLVWAISHRTESGSTQH